MKKVKSNKKETKSIVDVSDTDNESARKRKTPAKPKKAKPQTKKRPGPVENGETGVKPPGVVFEGIGEKDPAFSQFKEEEIEYPYWLRPENLKDALGRPYNSDSEFDSTTILIPDEDFNKLPPIFKQYWEIKSKNFDKIVFFRMGFMFFCFYDDAITMGKLADIKVSFWGTRPYVLIFPKSLRPHTEKLIELGYKCVTVEQLDNFYTKKDSLCKREVVEVLSKGTTTDETFWKDHSEPKFLMCVLQRKNVFGVTFVDCLTQNFYFDELKSPEDLKTVVYRTKPVEILSMRGHLESGLMMFLKNTVSPVFSQVSVIMPTMEEIFREWEDFFKRDERHLPKILSDLINSYSLQEKNSHSADHSEETIDHALMIKSLHLTFTYLKSNLIADSTFLYGNFSFLNLDNVKSERLYMDSAALRNLEIFDVNIESKLLNQNSLFHYIDKTRTGYGRRLLKKWVESPLRNIHEINERLNAIEDLNKNCNIADYFHSKIAKLPDFERALGRIYSSTNKQKLSLSSFDGFASNRLNDFFKLLEEFSKIVEIIESFDEYKSKFKSTRLRRLVTIKSKGTEDKALFPDISLLRKEILEMVEFQNETVVPRAGTNAKYDEIADKIKGIQEKLNEILYQLRKKLKCTDVCFNHNKIRRYELEVPDTFSDKMPSEFFMSSKRKGFIRYQSSLIENFVQELEGFESELNEALAPFFLDVFKKFYEKQNTWLQVISCLAELDCLVGLSKHIVEMNPFSCRPTFTEDQSSFQLTQVFHPCLIEFVPHFVPNNIFFSEEVQALLITGPNMGGKSTILRQACVAIILAQIGSYVPAKSFVLCPIDRIFCRIGANDKILEGKSTFFMEMEESSSIIKEATRDSFVIFDELGRGTSTYDGVALAFSVLKYVVEELHCKTMFSTHYHLLVDEFKFYKGIRKYFMDFRYDEEKEEIEFFYKFIEGEACKSFGINVAKIVGVPEKVLEIAKEKATTLNTELANLKGMKTLNEKFNECLNFLNS